MTHSLLHPSISLFIKITISFSDSPSQSPSHSLSFFHLCSPPFHWFCFNETPWPVTTPPPYLFFFFFTRPYPPFISIYPSLHLSLHPSLQWRGGMQGHIPGLMKLILLESLADPDQRGGRPPHTTAGTHTKTKELLFKRWATQDYQDISTRQNKERKTENRKESEKERDWQNIWIEG